MTDDWQPISTAPRDGTEVSILGARHSKTAYYDPDLAIWFGDQYCAGDGPGCDSCHSCDDYIEPTHWKPCNSKS